MTTSFLAPVPLRYSAFICYDPADDDLAANLHASLETYAIPGFFRKAKEPGAAPPARLYPIFLDKEELPLAAFDGPATKHLRLGLKQSKHLVVMLTPQSAGSVEMADQIRHFIALGEGRRIVCVLTGSREKEPAADPRTLLPDSLRTLTNDSAQSGRLIILDERGNNPARQELRLRMVAALTGIDYETLRQRDHERQVRRLKITAAVVVSLLIALVAMGTELFRQEKLADDARKSGITGHSNAPRARP